MSRKIWRKLGLVAVSCGTVFGGLGCIGLGDGLAQQFLLFSAEHAVYDSVLAPIINPLIGGAG